jgi:predicted deacylase
MPIKKTVALPSMTPGTSRQITTFQFGKAGARPKVYMQAAIHANEMPGTMALHHLMPLLAEAESAGRLLGQVIVVPTVNPIGQSQLVGNQHWGRYDMLSYSNFNRNWLDLSEPVAERVGRKLGQDVGANTQLIRKAALDTLKSMRPVNELQTLRVEMMKLSIDADIVLDLHCDLNACLHLFISEQDAKGTARELAADLGAQAALYNEPYPKHSTFSGMNGALWARLAERFPDAAIAQACFSCTVEMRSDYDVSDAQGRTDAANLLRFLTRKGVLAGKAAPLPRLKAAPTPMSGMDVGYGPRNGFIVYHVNPGDKVKKGQVVCEIIDPADPRGAKARTPMKALTDGVLFSRRSNGALAWPGMVCYRIAGATVLSHRVGMSGLDD